MVGCRSEARNHPVNKKNKSYVVPLKQNRYVVLKHEGVDDVGLSDDREVERHAPGGRPLSRTPSLSRLSTPTVTMDGGPEKVSV